jgi:hypothetical protein
MQRVTQAHLNSSSNESEDSDNYENLVNHSSKSMGQNFFNDFRNETHTPTKNNSLKNSTRNNDGFDAVSKKQLEKYKIENLSNSDYSESPLNEDFNEYFK